MKQSIFQKLFSKNRLVSVVLAGAFGIWLVLQIPLIAISISVAKNNQEQLQTRIERDKEQILAFTLQVLARFGDIVNSKQQIITIGQPMGLIDLELCKDGLLLLSDPLHSACPTGKPVPTTIAGQEIELFFKWDEPTSAYFLDSSLIYLSLGSFFLIFAIVYFAYTLFTSKVRLFSQKILMLQTDPNILEGDDILPELQPVVGKLNELIAQSKSEANSEKQNYKVDLAKQLAHDIRAPLSALNILISTMPDLPEEQGQVFRNSIERINRIAMNLLNDSKRETGLRAFDIVQSIKDVIQEKETKYKGQKVQINFSSVIGHLEYRLLDKFAFESILSNLIENSVEAKNGELTISVRILSEPGGINIEVADNGSGIPPHVLEELGEKGFSTKAATDRSGAGLGVFNAFKEVRAIKGSIQYYSEQGKGTLVEIKLPIIKKS